MRKRRDILAHCWDSTLPPAIAELMRDYDHLYVTALAPDQHGRQRFLISRRGADMPASSDLLATGQPKLKFMDYE